VMTLTKLGTSIFLKSFLFVVIEDFHKVK